MNNELNDIKRVLLQQNRNTKYNNAVETILQEDLNIQTTAKDLYQLYKVT